MILFSKNRNLLPVFSIEGGRYSTDMRRGDGIYDTVAGNMDKLRKKNIIFGASVTVTSDNINEILTDEFVNGLLQKGVSFIFYVEYVPIDGNNAEIATGGVERRYLGDRVAELREKYKDIVFVAIPGDEQAAGGCLAAGRFFFHINPKGDAESCPMSPYSDVNVKDASLEEALRSPFFASLKNSGLLSESHEGGCALAMKRKEVEEMLEDKNNDIV